jgi:hypothetical protein
MRPGGGKQKGASFEREVCVALSRWITDDAKDDVFWRSAMSGGRATVSAKNGGKLLSNQVGDISAIDPVGSHFINEFAVECKFYAQLDYAGLLTGSGRLLSFWYETKTEAANHKKRPFLVARQNRMHPMVCLDRAGMGAAQLQWQHMEMIVPPYDLYMLSLKKFINVVDCRRFTPNGTP